MKKLSPYIFLIFLFNFYISVLTLDAPKNYFKGKFYSSIKNNFLVATDKMRDPKFKNTVVVMLDNDESGAFGLVIIKPLGSIPLSSLIIDEVEQVLEYRDLDAEPQADLDKKKRK